MKEVILFLVLLPFNHQPETSIKVETYATRDACVSVLKEHSLIENKKYLLKQPSTFNEVKTFGKTFRDPVYGVMRMGYYSCSTEPPTNLQSEVIKK